jgi:threonine dehydrogenase-like Zn-dependent dehydrogenase
LGFGEWIYREAILGDPCCDKTEELIAAGRYNNGGWQALKGRGKEHNKSRHALRRSSRRATRQEIEAGRAIMRMKATQVVARGRAAFVDVPVPQLRPGHVIVRARRLSLCGSDIRMLHHAPEDAYPFPPGTTGHEMVGVIEDIDAPESVLQIGDSVLALAPNHRAMAEYFLAPVEHVIPLPSGISVEHLLQAQQLGTVLFACQRLPDVSSKTVAVIGQGSAGLYFDFQLRQMGAGRVIALDLEAFRLERSMAFGATHTIHNASVEPCEAIRQINGGELADVVVEVAGDVPAINLAIDLVRHGGDILYFGYPRGQTIPFNFDRLFHKCCRAQTIVGATVEPNQASTRKAVELITRGRIDVSRVITHRFPFAHIVDAYELHRTHGDGCVKIVIEMPE